MCQTTQQNFTAVTGMVNVQSANTNLDGSGNLNLLITAAPHKDGLFVKTITLKAIVSNGLNTARIFIQNKTGAFLFREIPIPSNDISSTQGGYSTQARMNFMLEPGDSLSVTTENAENWNFIAEAVNWKNCPCPTPAVEA